MRLARFLAFVLLCSALTNVHAQETGFLDRNVSFDDEQHKYQVFLPHNYDPSVNWPVILFLHGAGERGDDGLKQTQVGLGRAIRTQSQRWPAIAIFPQVPASESWQGLAGDVAIAALDATIEEFSADESRVYLTGLSLGGNGTWYLGYEHTERFAALVAVCGFVQIGDRFPSFLANASDPYQVLAEDLAEKPIWIVHGDADVVVSVEESRKMASALESVGARYHYTELPGVNHNSWDAAYADEEMINWLFQQRLN